MELLLVLVHNLCLPPHSSVWSYTSNYRLCLLGMWGDTLTFIIIIIIIRISNTLSH